MKRMQLSSNVPCLTFIKTVIFELNYGGRRLQFNGHVLSWPQVSHYKGEVQIETIWTAPKYPSSADRWSKCRLLNTRDDYLDADHVISTCWTEGQQCWLVDKTRTSAKNLVTPTLGEEGSTVWWCIPAHDFLQYRLSALLLNAVAYRGRGSLGCSSPPPEIPKAFQNHAKLNPIVKTVKNCWI